jgi:hypothetical protein
LALIVARGFDFLVATPAHFWLPRPAQKFCHGLLNNSNGQHARD